MNEKSKNAIRQEFKKEKEKLKDQIYSESETLGPQRLKKMHEICESVRNKDYFINRDFYIVLVITERPKPTLDDPYAKEPYDHYFTRRTCPTPGYNQNVFKYHHHTNSLEYLWTIPKENLYWKMWVNKEKYLANPKTKLQMSFICAMESGQLLNWVKKECGENLKDGVIKLNQPPPQIIEA